MRGLYNSWAPVSFGGWIENERLKNAFLQLDNILPRDYKTDKVECSEENSFDIESGSNILQRLDNATDSFVTSKKDKVNAFIAEEILKQMNGISLDFKKVENDSQISERWKDSIKALREKVDAIVEKLKAFTNPKPNNNNFAEIKNIGSPTISYVDVDISDKKSLGKLNDLQMAGINFAIDYINSLRNKSYLKIDEEINPKESYFDIAEFDYSMKWHENADQNYRKAFAVLANQLDKTLLPENMIPTLTSMAVTLEKLGDIQKDLGHPVITELLYENANDLYKKYLPCAENYKINNLYKSLVIKQRDFYIERFEQAKQKADEEYERYYKNKIKSMNILLQNI